MPKYHVVEMSLADKNQLMQIFKGDTQDSDLLSKDSRDKLVRIGLIRRCSKGMNSITIAGATYAELLLQARE